MISQLSLPFGTEPAEEVPLPNAPLVSVISQVRFPEIISVSKPEFVAGFQEAIRRRYPVARPERQMQAVITPQGVSGAGEPATVWRFHDREDAWHVSLASGFVALDSRAYESRQDFIERLEQVLVAVSEHIAPAVYDRLGLRYVDRVELPQPAGRLGLAPLVRSEIAGVTTAELGEDAVIEHSICDSVFQVRDATLHARWGLLPPGAAIDPIGVGAAEGPSWILDLDMFRAGPGDFDVRDLITMTSDFSDQIYRFFRWAVSPEFLRRFGGAV